MAEFSRRSFLQKSTLAVGAAGASRILLPPDAQATEPSGSLGDYQNLLVQDAAVARQAAALPPSPSGVWSATEDNILGPFFRKGSPYRAKITPPLAEGRVLLVSGHVFGLDTRKPLAGALLDIWQANHAGRYDNDDPNSPPQKGVFNYRARLLSDENGYYEYETIHPAPYRLDRNNWRPSHIHYLVRAPGYQQLITQLYFEGDKYNDDDRFIKEPLIMGVQNENTAAGAYERGVFDIVLAKA